MHREASISLGPTSAWVGQASMHRVQLPQRSAATCNSSPAAISSEVTITPSSSQDPNPWFSTHAFLPIHPTPAFAAAACKYDLSSGSIKLRVPVSQAYTSVSFYTNEDISYYAINDRSSGRKVIELDLMTPQQKAALPEDEDITAADRLIIESPTPTGLIVMRALAAEPGLMAQAKASLAAASCKVQAEVSQPMRR